MRSTRSGKTTSIFPAQLGFNLTRKGYWHSRAGMAAGLQAPLPSRMHRMAYATRGVPRAYM
jgi:hypothetical protein